MEYRAFALKYRPKNFAEVVGQEHVVAALKKSILSKRIHHAYLFSGPRGVGKTSVARIFAKSLNCHQGPSVTPCEKCLSCQEITKGTSFDVIEIDGASNRGIDDIRTLRENVKLAPAHSQYKIYIIDEVHQITSDGFNALLKTLEEPPSHVKFIFATTHPQKVLPTILSRCQKFQFNLLPVEKIAEKLKKIIDTEKLKVDESLIYVVARSSEGSIRDAESLLDQLIPILIEKQSPYDIISFLGIIDESSLNAMVRHIVSKDLEGALSFINKLIQDGKDLGIFLNSLIEHLRNILLIKLSPRTFKELVYLSPGAKKVLTELAQSIEVSGVLRLIDALIEAKDLAKKLNSVRIPFEVALIKFCYNPHVPHSTPVVPSPSLPDNSPQDRGDTLHLDDNFDDIDFEEQEEKGQGEDSENSGDHPLHAEGTLDLAEIKKIWPQAILELRKVKMSLASYLSEATLSISGDRLLFLFPRKFSFHKEIVENKNNRIFLEHFLGKFFNKVLKIKFDLFQDSKEEHTGEARSPEDRCHLEGEGDFINELLDTFEGTIDTRDE